MSTESGLVCWECGASLEAVSLPLRRLEVCLQCEAELHVCRMCRFYDRNAIDQCTEEDAEEVREKARANFCDYFKPRAGAYQVIDTSSVVAARSELKALFRGASKDKNEKHRVSTRKDLDDLFE